MKAIIFDLWATLFYNDRVPYPVQFAKRIGKDIHDYSYMKTFERNLMLSKHENLETPIRNLLRELHLEVSDRLIKAQVQLIHKAAKRQKPYAETLNVLANLKDNGYKLGLISNTDCYSFSQLDQKYDIRRLFNVALISYDTKILKPDPQIFALMINKLGVTKDTAVMVGDSLEDDVRAAERFGIKGILIDRNNKYLTYKNRITSLDQLHNFI